MVKFVCEVCRREVDKILFDMYAIGDRLLEGVDCIITRAPDGILSFSIHPNSKSYFEQFNEEYWAERALEYVEDTDIVQCMYCNSPDDSCFVIKDDEAVKWKSNNEWEVIDKNGNVVFDSRM